MKIDEPISKDVAGRFQTYGASSVLSISIDNFVFRASDTKNQLSMPVSHIDPKRLDGKLESKGITYLFKTAKAKITGNVIEFIDKNNRTVGTLSIEHNSPNTEDGWCGEYILWSGCSYPINNRKVLTTETERIKPKKIDLEKYPNIQLADQSTWKVAEKDLGFDKLSGQKHDLRKDIVDSNTSYPFKKGEEKKLLNFFTITDIHITDKESPNQLIYLQQLKDKYPEHPIHRQATSVYSPIMPYTTHVLDAVVQTVNGLNREDGIKLDLGISLGDTCNSTQKNETKWYIDILNGGLIEPSSGNHVGENTINYQKPFVAPGLNIPWYQVIGNHDLFWMGSVPVDSNQREDLRESYISNEVLQCGDVLSCPNDVKSELNNKEYNMGVIDGNTVEGKIIHQGKVGTSQKIVSDLNRTSLKAFEWINMFSDPHNKNNYQHGLAPVNPTEKAREKFACYSFNPKTAPGIKVICLDDLQREDDGDPGIHGHGFLDAKRWEWLKNELETGQKNNELMIIAAHAPIGVSQTQKTTAPTEVFPFGWADFLAKKTTKPNAEVPTEAQLISKLHATPNLLMWIAGHRHFNSVSVFKAPDGNHENSFWQVETSSLRDFPQQFRTFEISVSETEDIVSVRTTNVDYEASEHYPAAESRRYAVIAQQIANNQDIFQESKTISERQIRPMPDSASYNAILLKKISHSIAENLRKK